MGRIQVVNDLDGMELALDEARRARLCGMRPFGSVIVDPVGNVVARAGGSETETNPTRHSEMLAIFLACRARGGLLHGCTLYQTLEPCIGCAGFINHAKISRVVVGSLRSDLPQLFRQRTITLWQLLNDTSTPSEVKVLDNHLRVRCIKLFRQEIELQAKIVSDLQIPFPGRAILGRTDMGEREHS